MRTDSTRISEVARAAAKEHKLSEIIFSGCFGTAMTLILYGIAYAVIQLL